MNSRETDRYFIVVVDRRGLVVGDLTPDIFQT